MTLDTKYVSSRYSLLNHQSLKQYLQTIICIYTSQWSLITETLSLLRTIWHSLSQVLYQLCRSCPPLPHSLTNHSSAFSHVSHSWPITAQYHMSQGLSAFQTQPCTLLMITLLLVHYSQLCPGVCMMKLCCVFQSSHLTPAPRVQLDMTTITNY